MCAIIGISDARKAAELAAQALHAQQHRAEDCAGVASSDGSNLYLEQGTGLVGEALSRDALNRLHGKAAIGHTRYATALGEDESKVEGQVNIQPIHGLYGTEEFYIAHNGNIVNHLELRKRFLDIRFKTAMDSEVIARLLTRSYTGDLVADVISAVKPIVGSGSIVILFRDKMIALRDPSGNRPLEWGRLGDGFVFASETCALQSLGATKEGEVEPGTLVIVENGKRTVHRYAEPQLHRCIFELVYFSHLTSRTFGIPINDFRERIGRRLEEKYPVPNADIVLSVPDSGNPFALGFASSGRSGKYSLAVTRHHHTGRSFIQSDRDAQLAMVRQKFQFSEHDIRGKIVVVVDDSIVRLNTAPVFATQLWEAGAKEVHFRIGFPVIRHPCFYGVKMADYRELIGANASVEETRVKIGATSLAYLELDDLLELAGGEPGSWCTACMTGKYWH